jgi:hypothetical protein
MTFVSNWKPSRTARKLKERRDRLDEKNKEQTAKRDVRRRERYKCRIPLCGCAKLGLVLDARLEVSHSKHKGMGGNPLGDRSVTELMVLLCSHRHQFGAISIHAGTLRVKFLTRDRFDGAVAWWIDANRLRSDYGAHPPKWRELARELSPAVWIPPNDWQRATLERLAEMEL